MGDSGGPPDSGLLRLPVRVWGKQLRSKVGLALAPGGSSMAVRHPRLILATVAGLVFQAGGAADPHPAPLALRQHIGDQFQLVLSSVGDGRLKFQLVGCGIRPTPRTGWTTGWTPSLRWQPWMSGEDPVAHYVSKAEWETLTGLQRGQLVQHRNWEARRRQPFWPGRGTLRSVDLVGVTRVKLDLLSAEWDITGCTVAGGWADGWFPTWTGSLACPEEGCASVSFWRWTFDWRAGRS